MRLKDIANDLGITRQELKQELIKTNFGIDPDEREIPDSLAHWVIRVLSRKFPNRKKIAKISSESTINKNENITKSSSSLWKITVVKKKKESNKESNDDEKDVKQDSPKSTIIKKPQVKKEEIKISTGNKVTFKSAIIVKKKKAIFDEQQAVKAKEKTWRRKKETRRWKNWKI